MNAIISSKALTARPSSAIRSDYNKFSSMCHEMGEPILITRNGESDLVVMGHKVYNDMIDRLKLTIELIEADHNLTASPTIPAKQVFSDLREMIYENVHS